MGVMEEINLKELFSYFKTRIKYILIIMVIVLVFGNIYSIVIRKPLYKSNTTIILVNGKNTSDNLSSNDIQLNKNLVSTYSEIIKSRKVLSQVISNLNLSTSVEALSSQISVNSITNTEIIKINVSNTNAKNASIIANEIAKVFSEEVKAIYHLENVATIDEAVIASSPYNVNYMKDNVIYLLIGLVLSLGLIFITYYFDTTIKSDEIIEQKFGLTILGVVPKVEE